VTHVPLPTVTLFRDGRPHADLAAAPEMNGANLQILAGPSRTVYIGTGLNRDVVVDRDQGQAVRKVPKS
jgi:hypothetical protein